MLCGVTDAARRGFWAALGEVRRRELVAWPGWEVSLEAALAEGDAAWVPPAEFAREIAVRFDRDDEEARRWWEHLRAGDLRLACGCARGVAGALAELERQYGAEIARAARRFERADLPADDLVQRLREKLFTGPEPLIASYTGQGFLQNWVRVTTTRTFIDCTRAEGAREPRAADDLAALLPEPGGDPELLLLKREHAGHFKAAFAEAVGALAGEDRVLLKQHLLDRLSVDQLGALYRLHRATAARRVARARDALLEGTRAALARRLGLRAENLAGVLDLLASRLEVSMERLLR
jgi:RNA polymerase sigma-70 factor, ECF subfamily